ncbi:hypothetical protein PSTG_08725 [Puccinia striiformis f. sp. tritici PST-78]|uniref:Uncharacterized protein n=1 Tax=Puccinia striiformis f. sp. tritici PST-78 TaxID=1165861 RepID=A0A0L0VFI5_9BASI|nr:hypothetical protein PSTG_08725 [Puccinia striiformis f. sp. tritici PST-78]
MRKKLRAMAAAENGAVIASQIVNNSDPPTLLEQISHNTSEGTTSNQPNQKGRIKTGQRNLRTTSLNRHRSKELRQLCLRKLAKEGKESPKLKVSAESIQMISYEETDMEH